MSAKKGKVLMAMSGGIDSTVSALLLQEQGYELAGATFRTYDNPQDSSMTTDRGCCSADAVTEAKQMADRLGIEHHILDFRQVFREHVIGNFIDEYMHGRTPNPCVLCNSHIKWGFLMEQADRLGCTHIATGHYARIIECGGHWYLGQAADRIKDQTYFLWMLTEENLKRTIFPLGNYTKQEVRQMAADRGFFKLSQKGESQEICFIPDNNYRRFLSDNVKDFARQCQAGNYLDMSGKAVGSHEGFPNYTIGQRKGLKIAFGVPKYVVAIDAQRNTVTLGDREDLLSRHLTADHCRFTDISQIQDNYECLARIRYKSPAEPATISFASDTEGHPLMKLQFSQPVWGVTPGQSVVLYRDGLVIGGGIIKG